MSPPAPPSLPPSLPPSRSRRDARGIDAARLRRVLLTLLAAALAGAACQRIRVPLPWMIGPLLLTAAAGLLGAPVEAAPPLRNLGQWVIGIGLGLYFTPPVLQVVASLAPALLAGVLWALLLGHLFHKALARIVPGDPATTYFAAAIGGASEMAVMAERHGGRIDLVAAAHSLRVLIVVVAIPFAYQGAGLHGVDASAPAVQQVSLPGFAALLAASGAGALLLRRLGTPNPWVLGALAVTLVLTVSGLDLSSLPPGVSAAGQLFIGVALGTRFTPGFVRTAPRWLLAVALGTVAMIAASAVFAWGLAGLVGVHPASVLLGTSPGGIAEMCITAKVLQLGVPVVTAFHVVRYVAVLLLTPRLYRRLERRAP